MNNDALFFVFSALCPNFYRISTLSGTFIQWATIRYQSEQKKTLDCAQGRASEEPEDRHEASNLKGDLGFAV